MRLLSITLQLKSQLLMVHLLMAIIVITNFRNSHPGATTTPNKKTSQTDSEKLIYHLKIVEAVNQFPNGTWKAVLNVAGLPDPKPVPGYLTKKMLEELRKYIILKRSSGRPISGNVSAELNQLIKQHASFVVEESKHFAALNDAPTNGRENFPDQFDARLKWRKCSHMAQPTLNQGRCGCCYAVSSIAVMSDRICIFSNQTNDVHLSVADYLSCSKTNIGKKSGCESGSPEDVFKYWIENGITSGGAYGSNEGCWPYAIDNDCGRPCSITDYKSQVVPKCRRRCNYMHYQTYNNDKYFGKNYYYLFDPMTDENSKSAEKRMKWELMNRGPFVSLMLVPEDFLHYKSGVYQYVKGELVYAHSVRMIGWGVENNVPYWLVSNSWGRNWGENGFFKILRGSDHMLIECEALAGIPLL